jgi:hypothetical protein
MYNYYKKPGHIEADYFALKPKNKNFQQKGNGIEEVNFYG